MTMPGDQGRTSSSANSRIAFSSTDTKPAMLGGVIPKSLNANVNEPTTSIVASDTRASAGIATAVSHRGA